MGRNVYFPDKMLCPYDEYDERNKKVGVITTKYEGDITKIKSKVNQKWTKGGGSCYIQAVLFGILQKYGENSLRKLISIGKPDDDKATVHLYFKGEPYNVIIDKTIVSTGGDFTECSPDINMIMKAFMVSGLGRGEEDSWIEERADMAEKNDNRLNGNISFGPMGGGGTTIDAVRSLCRGLDLEAHYDANEAQKIEDKINKKEDIEDHLLDMLDKWNREKNSVVTFALSDMKGHAVSMTGVNRKNKTVTFYNQLIDDDKDIGTGEFITIPISQMIADPNNNKSEPRLWGVYKFEIDKDAHAKNTYEAIDVRSLLKVLDKKNEKLDKQDVIKGIKNKFKDSNRALSSCIKLFPEKVDALIENILDSKNLQWEQWNNRYKLEKMLESPSDEARNVIMGGMKVSLAKYKSKINIEEQIDKLEYNMEKLFSDEKSEELLKKCDEEIRVIGAKLNMNPDDFNVISPDMPMANMTCSKNFEILKRQYSNYQVKFNQKHAGEDKSQLQSVSIQKESLKDKSMQDNVGQNKTILRNNINSEFEEAVWQLGATTQAGVIWSGHQNVFDKVHIALLKYARQRTDDAIQQSTIDELYSACREYLDIHTDNGRRQNSIGGQNTTGGKVRKQAVVKMLKTLTEEGMVSDNCLNGRIELDFDALETSLAKNATGKKSPYADLEAETTKFKDKVKNPGAEKQNNVKKNNTKKENTREQAVHMS